MEKNAEKLIRCKEWIESLDNLTPAEQEHALFDFIEAENNKTSNNIDFDENNSNKIKKRNRAKNVANEILKLKCGWKECNYRTKNDIEFRNHTKEHVSDICYKRKDGDQFYVCRWEACGFETQSQNEIIRHVYFHSYHTKLKSLGSNVHKRFSLAECKRDSLQSNQLPELSADYACRWTGCGTEFHSIELFLEHVLSHSMGADTTTDGKLLCQWLGCTQRFPNMNKMKLHLPRHTGEKKVACPQCGTMFASNSVFEDHCSRQATPALDYRCDNCGKTFASDRLLRNHSRRHINSFKCTFCDMTCPAPSALIKHIRYRHLDYRPFQCQYCSHKMVDKSDLHYHLLRHEGLIKSRRNKQEDDSDDDKNEKSSNNRIYSCHCCEHYSTEGFYLTTHLIKNHGYSRASGFQRFRYGQSEDGFFKLIPVRYESLEVSNLLMEEQNKNEHLSSSKDFGSQKDFQLIQANSHSNEKPASFVLIPSTTDSESYLQQFLSQQGDNKKPIAHRQSNTELDLVNDSTSKKQKNKRVTKRKRNPSDSPANKSNRLNISPKNKKKSSTSTKLQTNSIQISYAEIDQDGNVIESEIISEEMILGL